MKRFPYVCLASFLAASPASSDPAELVPERVPAGAQWLLHLDVERLKRTEIWSLVEENAIAGVDYDLEWFDAVEREFGVNPIEDILSVTVYSDGPSGEDGALQLVTTDRIDGALAQLSLMPGHDLIDVDGMAVHTFDADGETVHAYVTETGREGERLAVVTARTDLLFETIRVLNGVGESIESSPTSGLKQRPRGGSFFFGAASKPLPGLYEASSEVFELARGLVFDLGEREGALFARAAVTTENPDDAQGVYEILKGLVAFGRLAAGRSPEVAEAVRIFDSLDFAATGNEVIVELTIEIRDLIDTIETIGR